MEAKTKEKGDMFDIMVVDEAKIRLGEEGWKQRYYQVPSDFALTLCQSRLQRSQLSLATLFAQWKLRIPLYSQTCDALSTMQGIRQHEASA